jgi:hypothetical protein
MRHGPPRQHLGDEPGSHDEVVERAHAGKNLVLTAISAVSAATTGM